MTQVMLYGMTMFTMYGQLEIRVILDSIPMMAYIQSKIEHAQLVSTNSYIQMKIKGSLPPTIPFPFNLDQHSLDGEVIIQYKIKGLLHISHNVDGRFTYFVQYSLRAECEY